MRGSISKSIVLSAVFGGPALVATGLMAAAIWMIPGQSQATPTYASQTGLACGRCHVSPSGGGARTAFGNAFAANGHKLPSKSKKASDKKADAAPVPAEVVVAVPVTCGFYSSVCNARLGDGPLFGYSNALMYKLYPYGH